MNRPPKDPVSGGLLLLSASFIWGFAFIPTRYLGSLGFGVFFEILCRFSGPIILLTPFFAKRIFSLPIEDIKNSILAGMTLFSGIVLTVLGLRMVQYGTAGVFFLSLYTVFVPLYFTLRFKQKITPPVAAAVALAVFGALCLAWGNPGSPPNLGTLFCVLASLFYAGYIIFCSLNAQKVSPQGFQFFQCLGILALALPFFFIFEKSSLPAVASPQWNDAKLWGAMIFLAFAGGTLAYQFFFYGQIKAKPTAAAIILSMQSVFAAITEVFLFKINLGITAWLGCGMIFAATLLVSLPKKQNA